MLLQHPTYTDHYYNTTTKKVIKIRSLKSGEQKMKVKKLVLNQNGYQSFKVHLGKGKYKFFSAHRFIAECCAHRVLDSEEHIDHIDQNPLNNELSNLRIVNRTINLLNSDKGQGYCYIPAAKPTHRDRYQCWFRSVYQGTFDTAEEAQAHYNKLKQACLEAELDGVLTLKEMIEEVA